MLIKSIVRFWYITRKATESSQTLFDLQQTAYVDTSMVLQRQPELAHSTLVNGKTNDIAILSLVLAYVFHFLDRFLVCWGTNKPVSKHENAKNKSRKGKDMESTPEARRTR